MSCQIRAYQSDDEQDVLNIFRENTPEYFSPEEEKDLIYYLQNEIEDYFVAEINGKTAGAGGINYSRDKTIGHLSWAMVAPEYHRQGIGTLITSHRIRLLQQTETIATIYVRTSQKVFGFYEKSGFLLTGIVKDYWAPGFDMYDMIYTGCKAQGH